MSGKKVKETVTKEDSNKEVETELQTLCREKRNIGQKMNQLETTTHLQNTRKKLKESNSKLSDICSNTLDKENGHPRLEKTINRLDQQNPIIQKDFLLLKEKDRQIEVKLKQVIEKVPRLEQIVKYEEGQIENIRLNSKIECLQKVSDLQEDQLTMCYELIEHLSNVLKPSILELGDHGPVSEAVTSKYQGLMRYVQNIRYMTWDDGLTSPLNPDSGVSSCPDFSVEPGVNSSNKDTGASNKTPILPKEKVSNVSTTKRMTKVKQSSTAKATGVASTNSTQIRTQKKVQDVSARNLMTKVYKSNRSLYLNSVSSQCLNENKNQFSKPQFGGSLHSIDGSLHSITGRDNIKLTKKYKQRVLSAGRSGNMQ